MAEPPGPGSANYGSDPSVGSIFQRPVYTPGLKTETSAITHAPELYQTGKLAWNMAQKYRNMGKGSNDSPVGQNMGSDGGSPVWSGPPDEGSPPGGGSGLGSVAEDFADI
jgi:hypothetical protein